MERSGETSSGHKYTIRGEGLDDSLVEKLLDKLLTGTAQTPDGSSPLHMIAASGEVDNLGMFLQDPMKFNINGTNEKGETPLFAAIGGRNWKTTPFLIEEGADVTWTAKSGETPMHVAANRGTKDILELLISKGANPHADSTIGTPLYAAEASGNRDTLEFLLELKADVQPNPTNSFLDSSPIYLATIAGSNECLELLLKAGANPNQASYLSTPLCFAATLNDEGIIRCLLKAGADPNMPDAVGHIPIEYAAWDGCREALELLFPVTSPIAGYSDWSVRGVMLDAKSKKGRALFQSKQKKMHLLAKAEGAEAFKRKNYHEAVEWYKKANVADPTDAKVLSNLSLCYYMMYDGGDALETAKACINLEPRWAKAHYREGTAWKVLKDFERAANAFSRALALDRHNKEIDEELRAAMVEISKLNR